MSLTSENLNQLALEPFSAGRAAGRLIFDFGVMASLLKPEVLQYPFLDFGAGTAWVSEFIARMGFKTVSFDIHGDLKACIEARLACDKRLDRDLMSFTHGDGHNMPFESNSFGHFLCYDTVHHMHDYRKVFSEFFRVLRPQGRGIFVEPGARHSTSPETISFVAEMKKQDPTWIERDVVLDEMDAIARESGFKNGITIVPIPHPLAFQTYSLDQWLAFREGDKLQRLRFTDQLAELGYWDRVVFFVDKSV